MPMTPHIEKHFTATETVRDVVIGMSDGLAAPFALAALPAFGVEKARFCWRARGGSQTLLVGGPAAAAAFGIARALG